MRAVTIPGVLDSSRVVRHLVAKQSTRRWFELAAEARQAPPGDADEGDTNRTSNANQTVWASLSPLSSLAESAAKAAWYREKMLAFFDTICEDNGVRLG